METKQQRRMKPIKKKTIQQEENKNKIMTGTYKEAEKSINEILKNTVGIWRIRTDKPQRTNNKEIKEVRKIKKDMRDKFHTACKSGSEGNKIANKKKKEYLQSQKNTEKPKWRSRNKKDRRKTEKITRKRKNQP